MIEQANFADLLPILEELRRLILEGDGSGRGRLPRSGYHAEPADLGVNLPAGARRRKLHARREAKAA